MGTAGKEAPVLIPEILAFEFVVHKRAPVLVLCNGRHVVLTAGQWLSSPRLFVCHENLN
jgi:hypothetical protein